MRVQLISHNVWDLVIGKEVKPPDAPAEIKNATGTVTNRPAITDANLQIRNYSNGFKQAASIISESISDSQIYTVQTTLEDPIQTWQKLQDKFARRSIMERDASQMLLLNFQHMETESANQTIERYEGIIEKCEEQGVKMEDDIQQRMLLARPNERYNLLKKLTQRSATSPSLHDLFQQMRDDDAEFQLTASPKPGSAALAEAIAEAVAKAEVMWIQKHNKSNPSPRPASSYTVCFACGEKGHYAKDCKSKDKVACNFCKRNGHVEAVCRQKKAKETGGEALFFHGYSCVAELKSVQDLSLPIDLSSSDYFSGETMFGELEKLSSTSSTFSLITQEDNMQSEILAINVMETKPTDFLGDTGASHHIVHKLEYFSEIFPLPGIFQIKQVQGTVKVTHWGTVILQVDSSSGKQPLRLTEVLYIDTLNFNILSLQRLRTAGFIPVYSEMPSKVVIKKRLPIEALQQVALMSESDKGRLTLDCDIISTNSTPLLPLRQAEVLSNSLSMHLLHRRLGHSGQAALHRLLHENMATGVTVKPGSNIGTCDPCQLGKLTRPPHPAVVFYHGTTFALELVVMDLAGPVKPCSLGNASYFLGILDVFTRKSWVFPIKTKAHAAEKIMAWKAVAENQSGTRVLHLRSDRGGEFTSNKLKAWLALEGVDQQTTPPYSPESNGLAERLNRSLQDKTRTIMADSKLPGYL